MLESIPEPEPEIGQPRHHQKCENDPENSKIVTTRITDVSSSSKSPTKLHPEASSITFEDYFTRPNVQRIYIRNILSAQLHISFLSFLASLVCTIISNQKSFLDNIDSSLSSLLVNTFVLLLFGSVFALIVSRYRSLNHYPWYLLKLIVQTVIRMHQAGIIVFWVVFICEKLRNPRNQILDQVQNDAIFQHKRNLQDSFPIYFSVALIYGLNFGLYLSLTLWMKYREKAKLDLFIVHVFSLLRICGVLLISVPVIFVVKSSFPTWDISQVFVASVCGLLDSFVIKYSFMRASSVTTLTAKPKVDHADV